MSKLGYIHGSQISDVIEVSIEAGRLIGQMEGYEAGYLDGQQQLWERN